MFFTVKVELPLPVSNMRYWLGMSDWLGTGAVARALA